MVSIGMIVEGHGDRLALPGLLVRVAGECFDRWDVTPGTPIRINRGKFSDRFDDYDRALQLLAKQSDAILVVLDSDDDDPIALRNDLQARAEKIIAHRPTHVAPAVREFEAWFLASVEAMRGQAGVRDDAACATTPESYAGAKSAFAKLLEPGVYSETVDQKKYCALIDLDLARRNSPSFNDFIEGIRALLEVKND